MAFADLVYMDLVVTQDVQTRHEQVLSHCTLSLFLPSHSALYQYALSMRSLAALSHCALFLSSLADLSQRA
jgi:hypothetical protein